MAIKQKTKSLSATKNDLSDGFFQLKVLNGKEIVDATFPAFDQRLAEIGYEVLKPAPLEIECKTNIYCFCFEFFL